MPRFSKSNPSGNEFYNGQHRLEHWYRDNSVYFITARCREGFNAFDSEQAKLVFWDRFEHHTKDHGFEPWVTTLLSNHYHTVGYLRKGRNLGQLMRKLHGSVAKLVNDLFQERRVPFWKETAHNNYFDGCLRDPNQLDHAFRYTRDQAVRARIVRSYSEYAHTRMNIDLNEAIQRAIRLDAFLPDVEYPRYGKKKRDEQCH